jgi:hypothetical protein
VVKRHPIRSDKPVEGCATKKKTLLSVIVENSFGVASEIAFVGINYEILEDESVEDRVHSLPLRGAFTRTLNDR